MRWYVPLRVQDPDAALLLVEPPPHHLHVRLLRLACCDGSSSAHSTLRLWGALLLLAAAAVLLHLRSAGRWLPQGTLGIRGAIRRFPSPRSTLPPKLPCSVRLPVPASPPAGSSLPL